MTYKAPTIRLLLTALTLAIASCAGPPIPDPSATPDRPATRTQFAQEKDSTATAEAESRMAMTATANHEAEQTETARAQAMQAATQMALESATEQAAPMVAIVRGLFEEGYITRTEGRLVRLPNFDQRWAQIDWYQWYHTGMAPDDFVIRVDATWESASETANWYSSGCGFVFREQDTKNHYLAYLGLDGHVYYGRNVKGVQAPMGRSFYGQVDVPRGQAELVLAVDESTFTFLVNGKRVQTRQDVALTEGNLALTLLSGTNKDYGTHCRMTDIDLWVLD